MRFGSEQGWWDRWDDVGPFKTVKVKATTWEDAAIEAGIFKSKGEARRNGWNGPAEGERLAKARRLFVKIV
jgi:hypothetical protein